ncbi:MAG: hypothetical protein ACKOEH_07780, partial [Actinomycetota bacterium]
RRGGAASGLSAMTSLAAIIGDPVSQSLSPAIHNAVFKAMRADLLYLPFLVQSGRLREFLKFSRVSTSSVFR